jgi:hypothetical protein
MMLANERPCSPIRIAVSRYDVAASISGCRRKVVETRPAALMFQVPACCDPRLPDASAPAIPPPLSARPGLKGHARPRLLVL